MLEYVFFWCGVLILVGYLVYRHFDPFFDPTKYSKLIKKDELTSKNGSK